MGYMARFRKATHMGQGNGKPLAFPASAAIPIIGQPFTLEGWLVQLLVTCKCDAPKPVLIIGQPGSAAGQCPSCKKVYQLKGLGLDPATQQLQFQLAYGIAAPAPPPPADQVPS